jgi:hypothetical protein
MACVLFLLVPMWISACGGASHEAQPVRVECTLELADGSTHHYENEYGDFNYREVISSLSTWEVGLNATSGYSMLFQIPEGLVTGSGSYPWGEHSLTFSVGWFTGGKTFPRTGEIVFSSVGWLTGDEWRATFEAPEMSAGEDIPAEHRVVAVRDGSLYALVP